MRRVEKTVFICYRRTNISWALAIFQALTQHGYDVFFDFESIASGDFERLIVENINARAHFLILLTPSALEGCNRSDDWLRREIETALDTQRNIVPLMLDGFSFGTPSIANQLTGKLTMLSRYNALQISAGFFQEAMHRLRERFLNIPLSAVLHPASSSARQFATEQQTAARNAPPGYAGINRYQVAGLEYSRLQEKDLTAQQWFERALNVDYLDEQLRCYDQAICLDSGFVAAYNNRGKVRREKGDLDGAVQDYTEAIRLDPGLAVAYNNRGKVRRKKGDLDGALQDYTEVIRLRPDDADAYLNPWVGMAGKRRWRRKLVACHL